MPYETAHAVSGYGPVFGNGGGSGGGGGLRADSIDGAAASPALSAQGLLSSPPPPVLPLPPVAPSPESFARAVLKDRDRNNDNNEAAPAIVTTNNTLQRQLPHELLRESDKGKTRISYNPWTAVSQASMQRKRSTSHPPGLPQVLQQNLEAAEIGDSDSMFAIGKAYIEGIGGLDKHIGWGTTWLQAAAFRDSSEAMVLLGKTYLEGQIGRWELKRKIRRASRGETEISTFDLTTAFDWFTRAAYAGDLDGMVQLGKCYENGFGTAVNPVKAFEWYHLAATKGSAKAQNLTGCLYWKGFGVPKDTMEACRWYRKAAEAGLAEGQANLGLAYNNGWSGGLKDRTEAAHWFWAAAVTGNDATSAFELGFLIERGSGVQRDPSKAFGWFLCAAEGGHVKGMERVARYLVDGMGVRMDKGEGFKWYQRAIENGSIHALVRVALMYERGEHVAQDYPKAFILFSQAADKGNIKARFHVGVCYVGFKLFLMSTYSPTLQENGWGVAKNTGTAVATYKSLISAHKDDPSISAPPFDCYYRLGRCYELGKGIPQDYVEAYNLYEQSYRDYPPSCTALAKFFQTGLGNVVNRDANKAFQLYEHAAARGDIIAAFQVGAVYASRAAVAASGSAATPSTASDIAAENMNIAVKYFRNAASYSYPPAMFRLGSLFLGDPKSTSQIEEGVQLIFEAARLGDVDAMDLLSKLYARGVEVDAAGQLVKPTESRISLFSSKSSSSDGIASRFSLTGRASAVSSGNKSAVLPTPPEPANGSNGSIPAAGFVILAKDAVQSNRWKQEAAAVRKEKDALDTAIAKAGRKKVPVADSFTDALDKLKI
ncbi:UNVERIFIED_CONTAM: hypothetical protein HDU68_000624 [Siphonaria sp. JEL0065]|nr:hypothetical protein HDU68_000624 [Siphonaria sp. JEL0065]